jgi:transposase
MKFLNGIHWRNGQSITEIEKYLIVFFLGAGYESRDIAYALNRDKRCIDKWINRYQETGLMQNRVKAGRPRVTTEDQNFDIILSAIENPFRRLNDIKSNLQTYLSKAKICRRLRENNFYACVARKK